MRLLPNTLLEFTDPEGAQEVLRILHLDRREDVVYVIRIDRPDVFPVSRKLSDVESGLDTKGIRILPQDPYAYLLKPDENILEKHRRRRDAAWAKIKDIVMTPNGQAFDPATRGQLIKSAIARAGGTKKHFYRYLRRYWQGGMTPNALLPLFHLCGGQGKQRKVGEQKRGRPRQLSLLKGEPPGINIDSDTAEKLRKGFRMFYEKSPENGGGTKRQAYEKTLQKFFHEGLELRNGALVPVLPTAVELPTYDQFIYWATKDRDFRESLIRRKGDRKFNLGSRPVLNDSTQMAFGPGSVYQIDTTIGDNWLVSELNRSRRLSRPIVVFIVCTFSRLIVGLHVGLENASFFSAGLALENAFQDKVAFCAKFGIQISTEEWPSAGIPEAILADRGELEGHSASNLVQSLGIQIANTSPYRADMKGIVERAFKSMNDSFIHNLPGAVRKPKERGERDPRLDAVLTLKEFYQLMIHAVLQHNSRRIEGYRLQKDMIADGVEPRPTDLWKWGIENRSGHLRNVDPLILRSNLLPASKATVTYQGIKFRGVYYTCDRATREHWYEKARANKSWQVDITYDPRIVDRIFLRVPGEGSIEACQLLTKDERFQGVTWADVDDFFQSQKEAKTASITNDLQSRANLQSQVGTIVKNAAAEAATANQRLTKTARLKDVRQNREEERRRIHGFEVQSRAQPDQSEPDESKSADEPVNEYVPPPSRLEMLRRQRQENWSNNE